MLASLHDARLQFGQLRIGVRVVHVAQQLLLGELVAVARSPPMHTPRKPGPQPLPCACQTASRMQPRTPSRSRSARLPLSVAGSEYWALMFSQPPPLRIRRTSTVSVAVLVPVEDGAAGPEVVAGVRARHAVHRVLPQVALRGGLFNSFAAQLLEFDLIEADRGFEVEGNRARVLADRQRPSFRQADVLRNQLQSEIGLGAGCLQLSLELNDVFDVRRQERRSRDE